MDQFAEFGYPQQRNQQQPCILPGYCPQPPCRTSPYSLQSRLFLYSKHTVALFFFLNIKVLQKHWYAVIYLLPSFTTLLHTDREREMQPSVRAAATVIEWWCSKIFKLLHINKIRATKLAVVIWLWINIQMVKLATSTQSLSSMLFYALNDLFCQKRGLHCVLGPLVFFFLLNKTHTSAI